MSKCDFANGTCPTENCLDKEEDSALLDHEQTIVDDSAKKSQLCRFGDKHPTVSRTFGTLMGAYSTIKHSCDYMVAGSTV
jgi:hypothetical protein